MNKTILSFAFLISASAISAQEYSGYSLLWSDEFDGGYSNADTETGLNLDTWNFETGNGDWGWGTGQRDYATTDQANVEVSGGTLKIRTQRNNPSQAREYTSGRLNTKDKQAFTFGKIEARIRTVNMTEKGRGFAFWLMPNGKYNGNQELMWPQGGEIDIFEYNGMYPQYNLGSVHHAWKWNNNQWGGDGNHAHAGSIYNPLNRNIQYHNVGRCGGADMTEDKANLLGADWHIYGINWYEDRIEFYVDQDVYHVFYYYDESWCGENQTNDLGKHVNKAGFNFNKIEEDNGVWQSHASKWRPFENPFYIILSAGVGGDATYGGNITAGNNPNQWTCTTEIDWVRVYQSGSDIITATTSIETGINIFTTDNSVVIRNAPKGALVKIIGIDGIVHYLATCTSSSEISIPLSSGYYVVCCNDVAQKVLIR
ncbi:MAG: glycoside hydrolase family 16 protein [Prevotellaceae bacterium]|jgi:beta-glucanase (GH16 family)|nr:glycoside hydrolase family 16 protein [Prevotellaceae bacterium]